MDIEKFRTTSFKNRVAKIAVPELKNFFPEGEEPVWEVRGVSGHEYGQIQERLNNKTFTVEFMKGISDATGQKAADAVKRMLGFDGETPNDLIRRFDMLFVASINPVIERRDGILLCDAFPTVFYKITNKILELTGKGKDMEGHMPCGDEKTSKPAAGTDGNSENSCTN